MGRAQVSQPWKRTHPCLSHQPALRSDIAGDELFSDTYPMKLVDDCLYEVYGKVSETSRAELGLSHNPVF